MDNLLPHYEHEVGLLLRGVAEFARDYPKIGARLGITMARATCMSIG
ncbi:type VI secretion system baseplate subunit TssF [Burkholderia glumae]|nr:type VI secretion system baseplate subunit TssF [Burkholderia glumae]MCM2550464.1 type VI secretion system baseplate subunit TssF [Burkholderia glumae]